MWMYLASPEALYNIVPLHMNKKKAILKDSTYYRFQPNVTGLLINDL